MRTTNGVVDVTRRDVLVGGGVLAAAACLPSKEPNHPNTATEHDLGERRMATITAKDETSIFYKDWGKGQPIVFSHGWPLNGDAWDEQMLYFASQGFRTIAHDRRGHGRSGQPWNGNDMDTYSDDLATLFEKLDLRDAVLVGHSTGGGEVARYLGRHGSKRVSKAILVGAVPPLMLKTDRNPGGLPKSVFDDIRKGVATNRSQYYKDLSRPFFGANRAGSTVSEGLCEQFWLQSMQAGLRGAFECIKVFSETDFTEDLKKIDVPVLLIHGDDDQIVPIDDSARLAAKLLNRSTLKVYPGAAHGLPMTQAEQFNADVMQFIKA
jgi:non-heme chloroperoxidase